ncbi:MAG: glycosyltransferase [Candidatus Hydrogenedentota bacterium]
MPKRIAIVHDWLTGMRGGEQCLKNILSITGKTDIYTLIYNPEPIDEDIKKNNIYTSFLQYFPGIVLYYRYMLPLFPFAISGFNFSGYDLVISISHCVAKSIKKDVNTRHISYCLTPMRYAYDMYDVYFRKGSFKRIFTDLFITRIREWDIKRASFVDEFVAISEFVRERISRIYNRDSRVIYPPARTDFFVFNEKIKTENYYITVSAIEPYKGIGILLEAFKKDASRRLLIVGKGSMLSYYKRLAPENVAFTDWVNDFKLRDYLRSAKGFIFPAVDDFGITPVEAMACGVPVIAINRGGAKETVLDGKTGLFFDFENSVESLLDIITKFERITWDKKEVRAHSLNFSQEIFKTKMEKVIKGD